MFVLFFVLCILPAALSLDAFEIACETAQGYRLTTARRLIMAVCFSFFSFIIPVVCSVLFRFLFYGLHILDFILPESLINLTVPLAVLIFFIASGGKKIVFGYIEFAGKTSPDTAVPENKEEAPMILLFMQAFAASTDMFGVGLLPLLVEVNVSLSELLKEAGISSGFLFLVLVTGITSFLTFLLSIIGSLLNINEKRSDISSGVTGITGGAAAILAGILLVFA